MNNSKPDSKPSEKTRKLPAELRELLLAVLGNLRDAAKKAELSRIQNQPKEGLGPKKEEEPMSTYRRRNNGEFNRYLARLETELREQQEEVARQQQQQEQAQAQQEANVALFLDTCTKAVEQFQNRSRLWWWKTIAIEWMDQRAETVVRLAKRIFTIAE